MTSVRKWGPGPYSVVVVHGGPGAPGEVAPIAREISSVTGVLEPFQTETTLEGQIQELRLALAELGRTPVTLVGFSWGAFLSWMVASRHPELVKKLILISSPPFEERYAASITKHRLNRLKLQDKAEAQSLLDPLGNPSSGDKNQMLARLGVLLTHADAFDAVPGEGEGFHCQYDVFHGVWDEANELRRNRILIQMAKSIRCPVVAIHGDWDPHPGDGVTIPLSRELQDFRFILLEKCGHRPWTERYAAENFFKALVEEI